MVKNNYFGEFYKNVVCALSTQEKQELSTFEGAKHRKSQLFKTSNGALIVYNPESCIGLSYLDFETNIWKQSNIDNGDYELVESNGCIVAACGHYNHGIYYSEDDGKTWNQSNINIGVFRGLFVADHNTIVVGSYFGEGIFYSKDNGKTWKQSLIIDCANKFNISSFGKIGSIIVASGFDSGILYSEDNGETWHKSNLDFGCFDTFTTHTDTIVAIRSDSHRELYYSTDGKNWQESFVDEFANLEFTSIGIVGDIMVAGGYCKRICFSDDHGKTWHKSKMLCNDDVCSINNFVVNNGCVIAYWSFEPSPAFISKDNGKTWDRFEYNGFTCVKVIDNKLYFGFRDGSVLCYETGAWYIGSMCGLDYFVYDFDFDGSIMVVCLSNAINKIEIKRKQISNDSLIHAYTRDELEAICNGYLEFVKSKKEEEYIEDLCENPQI